MRAASYVPPPKQSFSQPLAEAIALVKSAAKDLPAWITVIAWSAFIAVAVLFLTSAHLS